MLAHRSVPGPAAHWDERRPDLSGPRSGQRSVGDTGSLGPLELQALAGNRAVVEALGHGSPPGAQSPQVQRRPSWFPWSGGSAGATTGSGSATTGTGTSTATPAPAGPVSAPAAAPPTTAVPPALTLGGPPKPTWKSTDEATTAFVKALADADKPTQEAAKQYIFPRLNGMKSDRLVLDLTTVQRLDVLYQFLPKQTTVDIPRLATAMAGLMSDKQADTMKALDMLDQLRSTNGSEGFWTDVVDKYSADELKKIFLVADRKVIEAMRDKLESAPPKVHKKVGPLLATIFDPPASDIVLEFIPDQLDYGFMADLPDGTQQLRLAPLGVLTARVRGRVAASVAAQGGMWESQDAGEGHHADPTKPGLHKLGGRQKVRTSFWVPSQLAQETPLREVTKSGEKRVEYKGDDGRWHDTMSLAVPISRDMILGYVKDLREELTPNPKHPDPKKDAEAAKSLALVPEGVVPKTWIFNDFGDHAYRILGTDQLVHTSPNQEVQFKVGIQEQLGWSHGCLHLKPSGRNLLEDMHLLKGGVTLKVHAYIKGVKEYGKAPKF